MRPPVEPYLQGRFDGLCSVYALLNAVHVLFPQLDDAAAEDLFAFLLRVLEGRPLGLGIVAEGLSERELRRLARECRDHVQGELELGFKITHLPITKHISIRGIWDGLQRELDGTTAAIVGLAGREHHWTVPYRATSRTLRLVDSSGMLVLLRSRCTVTCPRGRYQLNPSTVILLRRGSARRRRPPA